MYWGKTQKQSMWFFLASRTTASCPPVSGAGLAVRFAVRGAVIRCAAGSPSRSLPRGRASFLLGPIQGRALLSVGNFWGRMHFGLERRGVGWLAGSRSGLLLAGWDRSGGGRRGRHEAVALACRRPCEWCSQEPGAASPHKTLSAGSGTEKCPPRLQLSGQKYNRDRATQIERKCRGNETMLLDFQSSYY
jgi:hypothetical protein